MSKIVKFFQVLSLIGNKVFDLFLAIAVISGLISIGLFGGYYLGVSQKTQSVENGYRINEVEKRIMELEVLVDKNKSNLKNICDVDKQVDELLYKYQKIEFCNN